MNKDSTKALLGHLAAGPSGRVALNLHERGGTLDQMLAVVGLYRQGWDTCQAASLLGRSVAPLGNN